MVALVEMLQTRGSDIHRLTPPRNTLGCQRALLTSTAQQQRMSEWTIIPCKHSRNPHRDTKTLTQRFSNGPKRIFFKPLASPIYVRVPCGVEPYHARALQEPSLDLRSLRYPN